MSARRVLRAGGLYFDGINAYAVVGLRPDGSGKPFTVYGWSEITIAEWIYPYWPKVDSAFYNKFSMIGDYWVDYPSTFFRVDREQYYTSLDVRWVTRRSDGFSQIYQTSIYAYRNSWVHVVRRFTADREISFWVNGNKMYAATIPTTEKTVLEWDPDRATRPILYKRFVLGANSFGTYDHMKLINDEVRIYNRALSGDEIKAIYERDELIKDGLVLCLDFTEGEGNIAYDKSGMGNHATIYGGARWVIKKAVRVLPKAR